ncbi:hypothetical protein [Deinococcus altitudinis]|uniref:hypothetical protein n=1 Tax=Deinococcus altitudinis TaxID=468914 RepID=UPI00389269F0
MRYRAEAYDLDTENLAANLGHFETRQEAVKACEKHAGQSLIFIERRRGLWRASAAAHFYGVVDIAG